MIIRIQRLVFASAALLVCANLYAGDAADAVQINDTYARAMPPGQTNSAAFMTLTNDATNDHALVAAECDASAVTELHTHLMEDGMMKMRRLEKIDLPAGETIRLQPGGLHLMLIGLKGQLSAGEDVAITLVFEDGSRSALTVPVKGVQETMHHHPQAGH
jgi:copper(I)-binding protein